MLPDQLDSPCSMIGKLQHVLKALTAKSFPERRDPANDARVDLELVESFRSKVAVVSRGSWRSSSPYSDGEGGRILQAFEGKRAPKGPDVESVIGVSISLGTIILREQSHRKQKLAMKIGNEKNSRHATGTWTRTRLDPRRLLDRVLGSPVAIPRLAIRAHFVP